ncbi:MAG: S1 RNA-binding domain-containing protein [Candidatus Nealsonbacteria bacterium]|nr:S1 RNA-binding domain-containing protein [Candidatus Nealsonbacteria bacterium]
MTKDTLETNNLSLLKPPRIGDIVEGQVIGAGQSTIYVDLGPIGAGIIFGKEFYQAKSELKKIKIGDKIFAKVVDIENEDGYLELSLTEAGKEIGWEKLQKIKENDEVIKVQIIGANKGGLIAEIEGVQGFLPVSQLAPDHYPRVEGADKTKILQKLQKLVGEELGVKIFDLAPSEEKLIFSEKATDTEKLKDILKNYKVGDVVDGEITGIVDFGAFIKFLPSEAPAKEEGVELEGLIHISELDWQLIESPSEIVKVGEKVKAKIIEITPDGRVSLSLRALKKDPWAGIDEKYKKNDIISGKVTKFNPFGAFVEVEPKIQGLCHISEFGNQAKMEEQLKIGKTYKFQILQIDPSEHRMTLKLSQE